jgi:hypothetical protein
MHFKIVYAYFMFKILCLICSKKGSVKTSGKDRERDGGPDAIKGGSVVLSKNVLDDGKTLLYLYSYTLTQVYVRVLLCTFGEACTYIHAQYTHIHTHTYTFTKTLAHAHVQVTNTLSRALTCTYIRTDTSLDRLTDPGVEFKGQHRSKVSSHGDSGILLDGDALDATATKLQVTLHAPSVLHATFEGH